MDIIKSPKKADTILDDMIAKNYASLGIYGKKLKELNDNGIDIIDYSIDSHYSQTTLGYTYGPNTNVGMTDCKNFEAVLDFFKLN